MPPLIDFHVDTGRVRFVMREYPIENLHRRAIPGIGGTPGFVVGAWRNNGYMGSS